MEKVGERFGDKVTLQMRDVAECENITTVWERYKMQEPHCKFGVLGLCCKNCNMGPCRISYTDKGAKYGVCGADADTISARNIARHIAAGSACHNDHGREITNTLLLTARGETKGYSIKDPIKLKAVANEFNIKTDNKNDNDIAKELAEKMLAEYGQQTGKLTFLKRAPKKQQEIWDKYNLTPRGIDREVVEMMARTNMGVDSDYRHIFFGAMRTALSDGWGGSMFSTELCDILFGSPQPRKSQVNLGVLKTDEVNILVHGHVPLLSELIVDAAQTPELLALAKEKGAKGINVAGICCTANEILMRRGIPVAGNFLQQEVAITTGAVELMIVDLQCVMPSLPQVASHFHTKIVSTSARANFPGSIYIEFDEKEGLDIAKKIIKIGVENFSNRKQEKVKIPNEKVDLIAGFTTENINYHLGGTFRGSYRPLNDAIMSGRLRGVVGAVGCDNPKFKSGTSHIEMVKELLKYDVLFVETGCVAIACAKEGLLKPEAIYEKFVGDGLREVCEAVGIPPILHTGSCVDNSRILIECCKMVEEGGIGNSLDELPVAGVALEWMSEKAIAIGWYAVASGLLVVFGSPFFTLGSKNVTKFVTEEIEGITGGKWAFEEDPIKAAHIILEHLDKKRAALKLKPMMYPPKING